MNEMNEKVLLLVVSYSAQYFSTLDQSIVLKILGPNSQTILG